SLNQLLQRSATLTLQATWRPLAASGNPSKRLAHFRAVSSRQEILETSVSARLRRSDSRDAADRECLATTTRDTRAGTVRGAAIPVRRVRRNHRGPGECRET